VNAERGTLTVRKGKGNTEVTIRQLIEVHARCHPGAREEPPSLPPSPNLPSLPA
jgi:hypothetical protein